MPRRAACGKIKLKRAYERPDLGDGTRILVDRLWPRGIKKADAAIDRWLRDARDEAHSDAVVLKELLTGASAES